MLVAYIDESVEPNGNFILAGYVSEARRWRNFSREWEEMLQPFGTLHPKENYYHFKYTEMTLNEERRQRIHLFERVAIRHAILAVSCRIHLGEVEVAKNRIHVPGLEIDFGIFNDPYKLAYRCLMDKFHNHRHLMRDFLDPSEQVSFVFDEQVMSQKDILASWNEYLSLRPEKARPTYGAKPVFRSDRYCMPLQAADLWAGTVRSAYARGDISSLFDSPPSSDKHFPCVHMEWREDDLVQDFINQLRYITDRIIFDVRYGEAWDVLRSE